MITHIPEDEYAPKISSTSNSAIFLKKYQIEANIYIVIFLIKYIEINLY